MFCPNVSLHIFSIFVRVLANASRILQQVYKICTETLCLFYLFHVCVHTSITKPITSITMINMCALYKRSSAEDKFKMLQANLCFLIWRECVLRSKILTKELIILGTDAT